MRRTDLKIKLYGYLLCALSFFYASDVSAQQVQTYRLDSADPLKSVASKASVELPAYVKISTGLNALNFRDFATSPLIYRGILQDVSVSFLKSDNKNESEIRFAIASGNLSASSKEHSTNSILRRFDLEYGRLFPVNKLSRGKYSVKFGALLNSTGNLRVNQALQNNAAGIEIISSLFGSIKLSRDISRTKDTKRRVLFFTCRLKEKSRSLSFRTNFGLINSSFRNGYSYTGQSGILNSPQLFDGYKFRAFSGLRFSTSFDYTRFLKNKNAIQFSYVWDAYNIKGESENFEMAAHVLKFSLLFNTNNK